MASSAAESSSKRTKEANQGEMTADVASLPDDVLENIFSFFPIKKAFSSAVISKRFKESWRYSRDLCFDIDIRRLVDPADIFNIIKRVMDEHKGPVIERLKIIVDPKGKENLVLDWIRRAIAKGVKELDINLTTGIVPFSFPSDILDGACLQFLKVRHGDLRSLQQFDSLHFLKALNFNDVLVSRGFTKAIFDNCLCLENFEIISCYSEYHLLVDARELKNFKSLKVIKPKLLNDMYVDAPSLQVFHYVGQFCYILLKREMPHMVESLLHFAPSRRIDPFLGVEKLMVALRSTKRLAISCTLVQALCRKFIECDNQEFQFCLWNLTEIRMFQTFLKPQEIASFLKQSPCLERLTIDLGEFPMKSGKFWDWELREQQKLTAYGNYFKNLSSVRFLNFKFFDLEMELARFIIKSAKAIKCCIFVKTKNCMRVTDDELDFLLWLAKEAPKARVYGHNEYTK